VRRLHVSCWGVTLLGLLSAFCYMLVKSKKTAYVALLDPSKLPYCNSITSHKFWIFRNTIFKNLLYSEIYLIWSIPKINYNFVLWEVSLFVFRFVKILFFLQYSRLLKCLLLIMNVKLEVWFNFCGNTALPKHRSSLVFRTISQLLPYYTISS